MKTGLIEFSLSEIRVYYQTRVPRLRIDNQGEWRGPCPVHNGKDSNFSVNAATGLAHCHSKCDRGWDIVSLEQELQHIDDFGMALKKVFEIVGRSKADRNGNGNGYQGLDPKQARPRLTAAEFLRRKHAEDGYRLVGEFYYGVNLRKVRWEHSTILHVDKQKPAKKFVWEFREGNQWFSGKGGAPTPLYVNSVFQTRDRRATVLGVEGEVKADALAALDLPAFSFREINDVSAATLRGQRVVMWPDKDAEGTNYCSKAIAHLAANYCEIRIIEPPADLPPAGDVVDALALGYDRERVTALMEAAKPVNELVHQPLRNISDIKWISHYINEKIVWACDGIVAERGITVLTSDSGVEKTMLALAMAWKIFNGLSFAGRATTKGLSKNKVTALGHVLRGRI